MKDHPVVRARRPFGLCMDILDFQIIAVDGKPAKEDEKDFFVRLDSKGRVFMKCKETGGLWERILWPPAKKDSNNMSLTPFLPEESRPKTQCACGLPLNIKHPTPPKADVLRGEPPKQ